MTIHSSALPWCVVRAWHPPDDPVNLIFYGRAPAVAVARLMRRTLRPRWHRTGCGRGVADLSQGAIFWGERRHIRIYDCAGGEPEADWPPLGTWSVVTVHLEHFDRRRRNHVVDGWNQPRAELREAFAAIGPPRVGAIFDKDLGRAGVYHGSRFDGIVTFIELR